MTWNPATHLCLRPPEVVLAERFPPQVSLRDVSRSYGRTFALHRINLRLQAGSVTAVVGDNGAGKSTLLNLLATVDQATAGDIHYGEMPAATFAKRARHRVGWVSHNALLYEELTARENLQFFSRMYDLDDAGERTASWLRRVGLEDNADQRVRTFSRGMKQRLSIARALLHNPQLLLLDEPATGLDQQGKLFVADLLDELRTRDRIVVLVTHDFELLDSLADRLVILRRGKLSFDAAIDGSIDIADTYRERA